MLLGRHLGFLLFSLLSSIALSAHATIQHANFPRQLSPAKVLLGRSSGSGDSTQSYKTPHFFDQRIDHDNSHLGKFKQRYFLNAEYYKPGGPIVLATPGEAPAEAFDVIDFIGNASLIGLLAQKTNGAAIMLEHRFFGESNPYPDLTTKSLRVHTIQQAIEDFVYFANKVKLPIPGHPDTSPRKTPWVFMGTTYSGALVQWTMFNKHNIFAAGYVSSAAVQAISDFWQYYEPLREIGITKNCSADIQAVIKHIDKVFKGNDTPAINAIKNNFGLTNLTHVDDVAGALRNNLWDWEWQDYYHNRALDVFCDALEVKDGQVAGPNGWGVDHALKAWGKVWTSGYLATLCGEVDVPNCLGTHDPTIDLYTNIKTGNMVRSWQWLLCNEIGLSRGSSPLGRPSLVSSLITPENYDYRKCQLMFPEAFPKPIAPKTERTNRKYGGYSAYVERIFYASARLDPYRDATISAKGTSFPSTPNRPIVVHDSYQTADLHIDLAESDPTIADLQQKALTTIKWWIREWKRERQL